MSSPICSPRDTPRREAALPRPPKDVVLPLKEIGARVRAIREMRDLTQAQLAELLGTRYTNISGVERGVRGLTIQQVVRLARALDVSTDALLVPERLKERHAGNGKLPHRYERIKTLPRTKQRALFEFIDAFLDKHHA
jgi:transcriptional regulator with XRE-family HTH domain